jgi:bifunctional UDP-N-acetylglucosamine pyrophosphorylase/glucosamine-1-phosphate N-acetyltransferase
MRSTRPKVLHPVAGRPMLQHVLDVARALGAAETVVVISPDAVQVRELLSGVAIVEQAERLGTGHAALQARDGLAGRVDRVLVVHGDMPLLRAETGQRLLDALDGATLALSTADLDDPTGYGRVVRDGSDFGVTRIVEEHDANPATRQIREVWFSAMAAEAPWLWEQLPRLRAQPNGEYYLTELVELALGEGRPVAAVKTDEPSEAIGVNSQAQLARVNRLAWDRETSRLMAAGVTVLDPSTTYVEAHVEVGPGTVIHPNTHLQGATRIGRDCRIGPNTTIIESLIGDDSRIWSSVVEHSELEARVEVGPFSHVRPGCHLQSEVHMGNFAETKASRVGRGTQMHHFSYVGDAEVGERVNIGAGTITCNYDGQSKHRTVIGDDAFIGSDTMLVAPLRVGARARTGAGSVVTRDVPDDATVVGVPARARPHVRSPTADTSTSKDGE